jgi:hypothetical protein
MRMAFLLGIISYRTIQPTTQPMLPHPQPEKNNRPKNEKQE